MSEAELLEFMVDAEDTQKEAEVICKDGSSYIGTVFLFIPKDDCPEGERPGIAIRIPPDYLPYVTVDEVESIQYV